MRTSKPVDELTIKDFETNPIWEWSIGEEDNNEQDETWVKPTETKNFTATLNGSIVAGELLTNNGENFPMMCSLDLEDTKIFISSVVFYDKRTDEYYALEEMVEKFELPLSINIKIEINGMNRSLTFTANKIDIYKNNITAIL